MKNKQNYKRTNIYLTQAQVDRLSVLSDETGVSGSEIVRRAINNLFKVLDKDKGASIENIKRYKELQKEGD